MISTDRFVRSRRMTKINYPKMALGAWAWGNAIRFWEKEMK